MFAPVILPSHRAVIGGLSSRRAKRVGLRMQDGMMLPKDSPEDILKWTKKQDAKKNERKATVQTKPYG